MKDIPIFTCADGIATLILREIPLRGEGYVLVRSVFTTVPALLRTCEGFCRAAGAAAVYFSGKADFSGCAVHSRLLVREIDRTKLPNTCATAVPIAADEAADWTAAYNARFRAVPAAQSCSTPEDAYYVRMNGETIGIGQISGNTLRSVASVKRGCGADCVAALAALASETWLTLLCAEENLPAMRLYDRLGFTRGDVQEIWYKIADFSCNPESM